MVIDQSTVLWPKLRGERVRLRSDQPLVETRNRKRLRANPLSTWELRVGELRLYDDVNEEQQIVTVRAIAVKDRSQVRIGKRQVGDEGV